MIKLKGIGHVNLRVADQEVSTRFYRNVLGFVIAEEDPEHGGVFMTLGDNFHTLDIGQHPAPGTAQRPQRGQIGLGHIAFQVGSYAALRDAYAHLVGSGVEILRATNHINQRSSISPIPMATRLRSIMSCRTHCSCSPGAGTIRTRR
jgi:catechol 2,3-dioxygenase-like lactoylglutathione lyase family enzyme